jgi:hypothetical protein
MVRGGKRQRRGAVAVHTEGRFGLGFAPFDVCHAANTIHGVDTKVFEHMLSPVGVRGELSQV